MLINDVNVVALHCQGFQSNLYKLCEKYRPVRHFSVLASEFIV